MIIIIQFSEHYRFEMRFEGLSGLVSVLQIIVWVWWYLG